MKFHPHKPSPRTFSLIVAGLAGGLLVLASCTDECQTTRRFTYQEPVFMSVSELRSTFDFVEPRVISQPGRIYFKDGFLFINEPGEGIHVIDNRDPRAPNTRGFIEIPGNYDLAISGNILYADRHMDLLAIDISDVDAPIIVNSTTNAFQNLTTQWFGFDPSLGVIIDWEENVEEQVNVSDCENIGFLDFGGAQIDFVRMPNGIAASQSLEGFSVAADGTGVAGSIARFAITDDYLYAVDQWSMQVFDISTKSLPVRGQTVDLGWGIETIFPYEDHLFLGAVNGMHIYDISSRGNPSFVSTYQHITSCDPVVVSGDHAYVTLRSGSFCQGFTNQLDVINISNVSQPWLEASFPMDNPHGLGIDGETLFIAEGEYGLKVFNASDIQTIGSNLIAHFTDIHALDVIPLDNLLMVIGNDGLFQYQYLDNEVELLSDIPIVAK